MNKHIALIIAVAGLIIATGCKTKAPQITSETTPERGSIVLSISATGVVEPQNRLEIKPPISGRIEEIRVQEGVEVKKGQILALMSSTERAALLDAARLQSPDELNYWKSVYQATAIIAPIDGKIIVRGVEPGQTISTSDAIFVISDRLVVRADIDETDIGSVQLNQTAEIALDAYPDVKTTGKVDHISFESVTSNNVTVYYVEIIMDKTPDVFRSGMSANIEIIQARKDNILKLSQTLIEQGKRGDFVYIKSNDAKGFKHQPVVLGLKDDTQVEIVEGLTEQDTVVTISDSQKKSGKRQAKGKTSPFMPNFRGGKRR